LLNGFEAECINISTKSCSLASILGLIWTASLCVRPENRKPSPILTARSNAASLKPPSQIGICGRELGFGVGIAQGYATLGQIGFADRSGYTAIGTVCNLAARLCDEAKDGQILVSGRVASAADETAALEDIGPLVLKGLTQPVSVFNVKGLITD
jgi:class 3 adenylate cyclase